MEISIDRMSVRINGLTTGLPDEDVMQLVQQCHEDEGVVFNADDITRARRVDAPRIDKDGFRKQSVIVQFTRWNTRCRFYNKRPKFSVNDRRFSVGLDLTKRRNTLLKYSREKVEIHPDLVKFVKYDINCNIVVYLTNGKVEIINSHQDIDSLLLHLDSDTA